MSAAARKVLLLHEAAEGSADMSALDFALRGEGAEVRRVALQAPYDDLLDALAGGWMPVFLPMSDLPPGH